MTGVRYFDVRHVTGTVTHVDMDNTRVESAGTSFVDRAILRVLGPRGWGILAIDHYTRPGGRSFQELLEKAGRLASLTGQEVILAEVPTGSLPVPPMKEALLLSPCYASRSCSCVCLV